jgi:hypothetical protein
MDFAFSEQQDLLRTSARQFLEHECPPDLVRCWSDDPQGYSPDLWQKMAALGWMGLVLLETYNGSGLSFVDLTILMEEMGRVLLPAPFFSSIALGALMVLETGSDEQCQQMLPRLGCGEANDSSISDPRRTPVLLVAALCRPFVRVFRVLLMHSHRHPQYAQLRIVLLEHLGHMPDSALHSPCRPGEAHG